MTSTMTCPRCGSRALFHSRRLRSECPLRPLFISAFRCHACGHRHSRISLIAVAAVMAVVLSATLIGVGEAVWTQHAQQQVVPVALAHTASGGASQ
jgi:DNA-directed RNA polymerase subunit RPC12/RpoP